MPPMITPKTKASLVRICLPPRSMFLRRLSYRGPSTRTANLVLPEIVARRCPAALVDLGPPCPSGGTRPRYRPRSTSRVRWRPVESGATTKLAHHLTGGRTMNRRLLIALVPLCAGMFAVGCTGPAGMTGAQGSPGLTGAQGSPGMTGAQGSAGMTGAQGSAGMTGVQGSAGMTGGQGPTGITGATGPSAPNLAPLPAVRWTSMKDFMFDFDRSDIRYSESKKPAEIA